MGMSMGRLKGILEVEILSHCPPSGDFTPMCLLYVAALKRHSGLICAPEWHSGIFNTVIASMVKAGLIQRTWRSARAGWQVRRLVS